MATFNALTSEQRQIIRAFMAIVRVKQGDTYRLLNDLLQMKAVWDATVQPVVALLDPGESIGDNSDLAGAVVITETALNAVMTDVATMLATYNTTTKRGRAISFAGIPNVIGPIR